jgi:hypothetical protein
MMSPHDEFQPGLCVDCGMSVPGGDIICDFCKGAWQTYSYTAGWDLRQRGYSTVQPGVQELSGQDAVQLVFPEETNDASVRNSQEG